MSQYGHQQSTLLQPVQPGPSYSAPPYPYNYSTGLTSPQTAGPAVSAAMGQTNVLPLPGVPNPPGIQNQYQGFDTTGQIAPPGMKPRVTATLWEDEGSLCFQVEARGICVARREDNHMINGTKLLNVAGMTRGRRDGILKSEKIRHVVKIGPMHLKGVWIPFERALDFANKEKITELLYPLFVHNIGSLLYHPTNQNRTNQVMAAAERRKQEVSQMRNGPAPGSGPAPGPSPPGGVLPSIQQHQHQHHHHMSLPGPQPLPSHSTSGRPSLDRAHTFPTPPTSASSVMGSMGAAETYWNQPSMNGAQGGNPMSIDTSLSNAARSMPATPATTPPGNSLHSMQSYPQATQPYDNSRGVYSHTAQQASYPSHHSPPDRNVYSQTSSYMKNVKPPNGMIQHGDNVSHPNGEDEAEHEAEYTHDSGAYDANRTAYNYNAPPVAPMSADHPHLSADITGSPGQQAHSGRATPRTAAPPQPYYGQPTGYSTPPRVPPSSSSLYNVMSNDRVASNGASASDVYGTQADINPSLQNGYATQPVLNGVAGPLKRGRDDEDELQRPPSGGLELKRRKTLVEGIPPPVYDPMNRPASTVGGVRRR
ncbi:putative cell pattern formation-associated protein stuA [Rosellinia necatrix]|uniref:Putative cell pattern formation-associated protein stuA n=1 Tax=Rosellinia necatrix TaxID=77044 RepID=A0A1S7UJ84_ROSNE|nr:putative cell pattern formation-associated protein stuA [Rosellinia necatrix]